ncbi:glycine cleavage system H protein [Hathewaya proteolytica DSM 3090]|uniref:Glycine cleavage system H protein n=1 Tax=Hathewaya proteolytica DSM 3090 TaxID=1121331 RepID=A0A1M6SPJ9_9CLOT|nr:glycine cleavage system protein GcvH [Hathewaya proteolytica]SHK46643.1 glycine cleavage system H protein [Hathewaya proteolytica DSM 3090]
MSIPKNVMYTKSHEWVETVDENTVRIGLTEFAAQELGDLVFINLPDVGDDATVGESLCDVESVKAVSDVFSPVTGTVKAINEELEDSPEKINEDSFGTWIAEIENVTDKEELLTAEEYEKLVEEA